MPVALRTSTPSPPLLNVAVETPSHGRPMALFVITLPSAVPGPSPAMTTPSPTLPVMTRVPDSGGDAPMRLFEAGCAAVPMISMPVPFGSTVEPARDVPMMTFRTVLLLERIEIAAPVNRCRTIFAMVDPAPPASIVNADGTTFPPRMTLSPMKAKSGAPDTRTGAVIAGRAEVRSTTRSLVNEM